MTSFFDISTDVRLLKPAHRSYEDLDVLAGMAETDVIRAFRRLPDDLRYTVEDILIHPEIAADRNYDQLHNSGPFDGYGLGYSEGAGTLFYITLRGFNPDPTLCEPNLALALKHTIVDVINWRCAQTQTNELERQRAGNGTTVTVRENANDSFPLRWRRRLNMFDLYRSRRGYWSL